MSHIFFGPERQTALFMRIRACRVRNTPEHEGRENFELFGIRDIDCSQVVCCGLPVTRLPTLNRNFPFFGVMVISATGLGILFLIFSM